MYSCYVLYSKKLDRYYIGETEDLDRRLDQHNRSFFTNSSTSKTDDWTVFVKIPCISRTEARKVERFIKRQKSRKFIEKLKGNPVMWDDLKNR